MLHQIQVNFLNYRKTLKRFVEKKLNAFFDLVHKNKQKTKQSSKNEKKTFDKIEFKASTFYFTQ